LCKGDAGLKPGNTGVVELVPSDLAVGKVLWEEHLRGEVEELKGPGHHSDHLVGDEIDENHPANYAPIAAEPALPVSIREDRSFWSALNVIFVRERPA
jgi:hypothetical protein